MAADLIIHTGDKADMAGLQGLQALGHPSSRFTGMRTTPACVPRCR